MSDAQVNKGLPNEVWLSPPAPQYSDGPTYYLATNRDIASATHRYILAGRVEKMIRLAVLEEKASWLNLPANKVSCIDEIKQLREELK